MSTVDTNGPAVALTGRMPLQISDIGRWLLWMMPAITILAGTVHARAEVAPVAPCPSGVDERAIDEWLSDAVAKRHTSPKYDGATRVSAKSVCNVKHWVVGQVKNDYDDVVDYQGRYSVFPPDKEATFTAEDVVSGVPWQITLADGRVLYPIEPLYWVGSYAHRKWAALKEPGERPTNVPSGAVWIGGLGKREAYVSYRKINAGLYEVYLFFFFRNKGYANSIDGPIIHEIMPFSSKEQILINPIFIDEYNRILLSDGSMLVRRR